MSIFKGKEKTSIKPKNEQRAAGSPKPVAREAVLTVDRNRWFYAFMGVLLLAILLGFQLMQANQRVAENIKVVWVKLAANGTWDIDFYDQAKGPDFYQANIDAVITKFIERRYSKVHHTIEGDYGNALQFMAAPLAKTFLDADQYNAAGVVDEFQENSLAPEIVIEVGPIDHYDSDIANFGGVEGTLYRSNIFVTETQRNVDGSIIGEPVPKIVTLQWRLKSKDEIAAKGKNPQEKIRALRLNPVGLEILKSDILDDPSVKQRN